MENTTVVVSTKLLSQGGAVMEFVAKRRDKDRITLTDYNSMTMAVIYTRDTPSRKIGQGYIVRNVAPLVDRTPEQAMGIELGRTGEKMDFPARLVNRCKAALGI